MKKATLSSNIICERGENEVKSNGLDRKIILLKRRAHTFRVGGVFNYDYWMEFSA